jgi:hypothetical protein
MSEHFCTYFDHRYAPKGLAMWRSLKQHCPDATLHVLCLTEACRVILDGLSLSDVHLYAVSELERADPELLEARGTRSLIEYYFTLTPCLPLYLLKTRPEVTRLTYVDADLFFFASPQPILDEIADNSIGIIEHRFAADLEDRQIYGRFNVGWLTFVSDTRSLECLEVWREQCIAWCYDRLESGRFAEQKYLDEWPRRFKGLRIIEHRGANVAPWNLNRFKITDRGGDLRVGGDRMIFYHAHGFEATSPGRSRRLNLTEYGVQATPLLVRSIFDPYESALLSATTEIGVPLALALIAERSRDTAFLVETLKSRVAHLGGQLSTLEAGRATAASAIDALRKELEESNAERAAHGATVRSLQGQLESSMAERAIQADSIRTLQAQLAEAATDRAVHAHAMATLQAQLAASDAGRAVQDATVRDLQGQLESSTAERAMQADAIRALQAQLTESDATGAEHAARAQTLQEELAAGVSHRAAQSHAISMMQARLARAEADSATKTDALASLQAQLAASDSDRAAKTDELSSLQAQLTAAEAKSDEMRTLWEQTRNDRETLYNSLSWRWTRPFRVVKDSLARILTRA